MRGRNGINQPALALAALFGIGAFAAFNLLNTTAGLALAFVLGTLAVFTPMSLMLATQWEKAVVLRLGKYHGLRGPGIFMIVPIVDSITTWLDQRIQTTDFNAEQALSKDTVPVNVDAVVFWQVHDAEKAALEITDYQRAIAKVSQTSLREMVGSSLLSTLLSDLKSIDSRLRDDIGRKIAGWGVSVISVEIRDVSIPPALQDAMSREAQAQREAQARVLLGAAEQDVAMRFVEAANTYAKSPGALQLRAMNIVYEASKEPSNTILIPTAMVDALNPGGVLALAGVAAKAGAKAETRAPD